MLLGVEQRIARGLHVVVEREVFAADAAGDDARARAHDFVDAKECIGGLDHGDEFGMANRHAAFLFKFGDEFVEQLDVRGAVDLGARDGVDVRADGMFEIAHRERQRAVDAHDNVSAAAAYFLGGCLHQRAGFFFFRGRHAVFDIELDHIGAARVCLVDVLVDVDRHVHERPPYG